MILDGWGKSPDPKVSAIDNANIPFINSLYTKYPNAQLRTDGLNVGLPEGQMGNSEVGHMNLGAGRIIYQDLAKINLAYIGDGNNVLNSLLYGATKMGVNLAIATPRGYEPGEELLKDIKLIAKETGSKISLSNNPFTAIKNAHAIYTDVWVSMGQEKQRDQRLRDFQPFQVNGAILSKAPKDSVVMHCLPAHRGEEITDEVIEHPRSAIFDQAENRLHTQKALLYMILTKKKRKN